MSQSPALDPEECLEYGDDCQGEVTYVSADGLKSWPRCEHHADLYLERAAETQRRYGGVAPPEDFDPTYAGERWDEDY